MFTWFRWLLPWLYSLLAFFGLVGCSLPANPRTTIGVDPFSKTIKLYNNKDVNLLLKNVDAGFGEGRYFKAEEINLSDAASSVRLANVEQMKIYNEQVALVMNGLVGMTSAITQMVPQLIVPQLPTTATTQPAGGNSLMALLTRQCETNDSTCQATNALIELLRSRLPALQPPAEPSD